MGDRGAGATDEEGGCTLLFTDDVRVQQGLIYEGSSKKSVYAMFLKEAEGDTSCMAGPM